MSTTTHIMDLPIGSIIARTNNYPPRTLMAREDIGHDRAVRLVVHEDQTGDSAWYMDQATTAVLQPDGSWWLTEPSWAGWASD